MTTTNIPLTTLQTGSRDFGPAAVADTDSALTLAIDRTVANGLNTQPASTTIDLRLFQSNDGGVTWPWMWDNTVVGGIFSRRGVQINTDEIITKLVAGTGRQLKVTVVVSGAAVAVQGSITTS